MEATKSREEKTYELPLCRT